MESHTQPYVMNAFRKLVGRWTNYAQPSIQHLCEDQVIGLDIPYPHLPLPSLLDGFLNCQQKASTPTSDIFDSYQSKADTSPPETPIAQPSKAIEPTPDMSNAKQHKANTYISETPGASQQDTNASSPGLSDALSQPHCTLGPSKVVLASDGFSNNCYAVLLSEEMMSSLKEICAADVEADISNLHFHQEAVINRLKETLQDSEIFKKISMGRNMFGAIPGRVSEQPIEATAWGNGKRNSWGIPEVALEVNEGPSYEDWGEKEWGAPKSASRVANGTANKNSAWGAWGGNEWRSIAPVIQQSPSWLQRS